jgi:hypothetical protein
MRFLVAGIRRARRHTARIPSTRSERPRCPAQAGRYDAIAGGTRLDILGGSFAPDSQDPATSHNNPCPLPGTHKDLSQCHDPAEPPGSSCLPRSR